MTQFSPPGTLSSIFELNSFPQLAYISQLDVSLLSLPRALHVHQDLAEIICIAQGHGNYTVDNRSYDVQKGDLIFINSGVLHDTCGNFDADICIYMLGIKQLRLKGHKENHLISSNQSPIITSDQHTDQIQQLFSMLAHFTPQHSKDAPSTEIGNHLLQALIILLHTLVQNSTTKLVGQDYNLGLRIKEYIDEHYLEDMKLADIADALHVNSYYLSHTFKKILGYSPMQYIIHRRIGEAQNLLITTDLTITEIALQCGYNNSNYFQVVFNTMSGMPPGKYRKAWRKETS